MDAVGALAALMVVTWFAGHLYGVRWLIERLELAVGRRFFPFVDRIFDWIRDWWEFRGLEKY